MLPHRPRTLSARAAAVGALTACALVAPAGSALASSGSGGGTKLIASALQFDAAAHTVTLPLHKGRTSSGQTTWYIVTDSSDRADAERRGVNPAPKLRHALGTLAVQQATRAPGGLVTFAGTVDFSPTRVLTPGPFGFPPSAAAPGAVGDAAYSPLFTTGGGRVLNGSHVANATGVGDSVVAIDYAARRVTLRTLSGFYDGKRLQYLRVDASDAGLAAIEGSNFAPNLNAAPGLGSNDPDTSARSAILPIVNGERGAGNPDRQGLQSALLDGLDPLNITQEVPHKGHGRYSPVWDVHPAVWTEAAIAAGRRHILESDDDLVRELAAGRVVSADFAQGPPNESLGGLRAVGFISNCPIIAESTSE